MLKLCTFPIICMVILTIASNAPARISVDSVSKKDLDMEKTHLASTMYYIAPRELSHAKGNMPFSEAQIIFYTKIGTEWKTCKFANLNDAATFLTIVSDSPDSTKITWIHTPYYHPESTPVDPIYPYIEVSTSSVSCSIN